MNHFAVQQKLTQHCKSTILQLKKTQKTLMEDQEENSEHQGRGEEECFGDVRLKVGVNS